MSPNRLERLPGGTEQVWTGVPLLWVQEAALRRSPLQDWWPSPHLGGTSNIKKAKGLPAALQY